MNSYYFLIYFLLLLLIIKHEKCLIEAKVIFPFDQEIRIKTTKAFNLFNNKKHFL